MEIPYNQQSNIIIWLRQVSKQLVRKMNSFKEVNSLKRDSGAVANLVFVMKRKAARTRGLQNSWEELQTPVTTQEHTKLQKTDGLLEDRKMKKKIKYFKTFAIKKAVIDVTQALKYCAITV